MEKSEVLYLLIGNNSMPNIISIATRVKKNGEIICLYTKQTEEIFLKLKEKVEEKAIKGMFNIIIRGEKIINPFNINEVKIQLEEKILLNDSFSIGELNFTGGTKILSNVAFEIFESKVKNKINGFIGTGILSYFDGENGIVSSIEMKMGREDKFITTKYKNLIDDWFKINAKDIIDIHNTSSRADIKKAEIKLPKLSKKIYDEIIVNRENAVEFTDKLFENFNKESNKTTVSKVYKLIEDVLKYKKWNKFKVKDDFFEDGKTYEEMSKENERKDFIKNLRGIWFEDYILSILLELEREKVIEQVFSSVELKKEEQQNFEVDFIVYKNFKLYSISVTTMDNYEEAKFKLYEVKTRGRQLAGDEARVAYINFCENSKKIEVEYKNIWDNELNKTLIISYDNLNNCKELIKNWLEEN